ncbi:TPA: pathogenicity island protein [Staphylococcus pseudintermedius]|nr:pathogenicity island protein [Staphylococcus pseudintermedius]HEC2243093.1 pathogenicity island protein [Staphylococcus delphini]EGQ3106793.1 pathogenicity island protein [Staphylococcus pseudintermedius]EHA6123914.1 pathogenicity island protein [Staphylococcus pseudintermedius]EIA4794109.1 pathogenicity island protein [Staphylococcus pseudintermedius]
MQAVEYNYNLDEQAERIGLIVGISEEIYFCSISYVSQVYVELINNDWVAWRETFIPNTNKRKSYKTLAVGEFELVLARVKNYLKYIKRSTSK